MHIMEPPDLWQRFIAPEYRSQAPIGVTSENVRDLRLRLPGIPQAPVSFNVRGKNYDRNQTLYADHSRRGWTPQVQLEAMDLEVLDAAVMFPSRALTALTAPGMYPGFANAVARAYNDWLHEFCQADPQRMFGAGMISVYDIGHAVEETHRSVEELGFKAIFVRSNVVNGKPWHDKYYEPLWDTLEKLGIPLGF